MKTVRETVALPDSTEQLLVHPLDITDSRKPFVASWWLSMLAMPTVVFCFAALLWIVSNNYVTPIAVPLALAVAAGLLAAYLRKEAWAYIPRKRQDLQRRFPTRWILLRSVVSTASLVAGLALLTLWIVDHELDTSVLSYILGTAFGIVFLMLIGLLWRALAPSRLTAELDSWAVQLTRLIAVGVAVAVACLIVGQRRNLADFDISSIVLGATVIIAVQVIWWLISLWLSRKDAARSAALLE
ncbi:hypothetical protein [uncultured Agrococcus sp.]|uniref:hypothetical protein n=1 Tax=uncultured Agrococcus sp. TaxID=382258 RepID=UPI0025D670C9|nr:hypothetical protein [uncultured Agrococcus sp.]